MTVGPTTQRIDELYDVAMLDLDGVVYIADAAVPRAGDGIARARRAGMRIAFITNNASRTTAAVAEQLAGLGIPASSADVVNSAQAAAHELLGRFGAGARIAVLGADGLRLTLEEAGLEPVAVDADARAIVTGYGPDVVWHDIMRAATRVRDGLSWMATNTDGSIPTAYGIAPGHGALVGMISRFAGVEPAVAGKPARPLLEETIRRTGARRPLMVGDRLDTDIAGGIAAGIDSMLVMTGVTTLDDLIAAGPELRPTYVRADVCGLCGPAAAPHRDGSTIALGGWTASVDDRGRLSVTGRGSADEWWQVTAVAGWAWLDATGRPADVSGLRPPEQVASPA